MLRRLPGRRIDVSEAPAPAARKAGGNRQQEGMHRLAKPVDLFRHREAPQMLLPPAALAEAEALLEQGDLEAAATQVEALLATDPGEAGAWFLQARLLAARGEAADALVACRRAIALWPDILPVYRLMLDLAGGAADDAGDLIEVAERLLLAAEPDDASLHNRIAGRLCAAGRPEAALPHLREAAPVLGHRDSALWNYTTSLALTGGYHELLGVEPMLHGFAREVPPPFGPFVHLACAKLALRFDRDAVLRTLGRIQAGSGWLDAPRLVERLRIAITQRQPFSLILLSEAHARLVVYASLRAHLILGEAEMSAVVNSVWIGAFGDRIEADGAAAAAAMGRAMLAAIAEADVIALPDRAHLAAAHEHFGFLAEMLRIAEGEATLHAGLSVLGEMHDLIPFLRPLLADQPFLGVVGPYPDLAERLARFSQIDETATYLVPAALDRHGIAPSLRGSGHYPMLFEQTLASLAVPFPGALFLVAAGVLGTAYCGRIRQLGGIAIDIDSVVGRWMP